MFFIFAPLKIIMQTITRNIWTVCTAIGMEKHFISGQCCTKVLMNPDTKCWGFLLYRGQAKVAKRSPKPQEKFRLLQPLQRSGQVDNLTEKFINSLGFYVSNKAEYAQVAMHLPCKQETVGSSPTFSSQFFKIHCVVSEVRSSGKPHKLLRKPHGFESRPRYYIGAQLNG